MSFDNGDGGLWQMLKPSSPEVAECYARAQEARERADSTQNLKMRAIYLDSEQRWLELAASYEVTARITKFLGQEPIVNRGRTPANAGQPKI